MIAMKPFSLRALSSYILLLFGLSFTAQADVLKIHVDDTIQPISAEFIVRAIDKAKAEHYDALLIELHTPGGLISSTREIIEKILASDVPVIVFVTPSGGYAASAGFFILESADVAAMSPGTNTGAAHPVLGNGEKMEDVMKMKLENDAAAFMRAFVAKRGRNVELAESAVRESKSWTEQEALDKKIIDVIAKDDSELLAKLNGREITRFDGKKSILHLAGKKTVLFEMSLKQDVLAWLMDPNVVFLLFSIGMLALYAEFNHPGAVIPGVVGIVCILLSVFALNILPTNYASLLLIVSAFVMFGLEAKFQTHGVLGIGGVVVMVFGALMLVDGPIPEMRVRWQMALAVSAPFGLITIFLMNIAMKARKNKLIVGRDAIVGSEGKAETALHPSGKVIVMGDLWNAVCTEEVEAGELIIVRKITGLQLEVERKYQKQAVNTATHS